MLKVVSVAEISLRLTSLYCPSSQPKSRVSSGPGPLRLDGTSEKLSSFAGARFRDLDFGLGARTRSSDRAMDRSIEQRRALGGARLMGFLVLRKKCCVTWWPRVRRSEARDGRLNCLRARGRHRQNTAQVV